MKIIPRALVLAGLLAGCGGPDADTTDPAPLSDGAPFEFPVALWDQAAEGETLLMVHVTAVGDVDSLYVKESSGFAEFDSAAVSGARTLRFVPGRRGDKRVAMWVGLPVKFARDGERPAGDVPAGDAPPAGSEPTAGGEPAEPDAL